MIPIVEEATLRAAISPARAVDVIFAAFVADGGGQSTDD